jgi:hypothetical protein
MSEENMSKTLLLSIFISLLITISIVLLSNKYIIYEAKIRTKTDTIYVSVTDSQKVITFDSVFYTWNDTIWHYHNFTNYDTIIQSIIHIDSQKINTYHKEYVYDTNITSLVKVYGNYLILGNRADSMLEFDFPDALIRIFVNTDKSEIIRKNQN